MTDSPFSWQLALDVAMRGALVALLLLTAALLLRERWRLTVAKLGIALSLGLCVHLVHSSAVFHPYFPKWLDLILVSVANGNNPLFLLFALAIFGDDFRLRTWHFLVWVAVVLLASVSYLVPAPGSAWYALSDMFLAWSPMLFAVLAVISALQHWNADLIERRRWLRAFIAVGGALYLGATTVARAFANNRELGVRGSFWEVFFLLVIVSIACFYLLALNHGEIFGQNIGANISQSSPQLEPALVQDLEEDRLGASLLELMSVKRVYREENLSISALAKRLQVPEYRLRRLINQRLGHRNFNAYVNGYRLDEVRANLDDPSKRHLPVLTLALEAGFQSIGPFNRAFKVRFGQTPTELRKNS